MKFKLTGEVRAPKDGEWFLLGDHPVKCIEDYPEDRFGYMHVILEEVDESSPIE